MQSPRLFRHCLGLSVCAGGAVQWLLKAARCLHLGHSWFTVASLSNSFTVSALPGVFEPAWATVRRSARRGPGNTITPPLLRPRFPQCLRHGKVLVAHRSILYLYHPAHVLSGHQSSAPFVRPRLLPPGFTPVAGGNKTPSRPFILQEDLAFTAIHQELRSLIFCHTSSLAPSAAANCRGFSMAAF